MTMLEIRGDDTAKRELRMNSLAADSPQAGCTRLAAAS